MKNVFIVLSDGFEEMEVVVPADLMRRAGLTVTLISMMDTRTVQGSRGISLQADKVFSEFDDVLLPENLPDAIFCPGGLNGSIHLSKHPFVKELLLAMKVNNKIIAAICAAPIIVLAPLGLVDGKKFTCYPGMEKTSHYAPNADFSGYTNESVVKDGLLLTSQGPGTASSFAFNLIELLADNETSTKVKEDAIF